MSAIREALRLADVDDPHDPSDDVYRETVAAALAELVAMERVVEAARARWAAESEEAYYWDREDYGAAARAGEKAEAAVQELDEALAALAELDGQTRACCGDPGDCGETCA